LEVIRLARNKEREGTGVKRIFSIAAAAIALMSRNADASSDAPRPIALTDRGAVLGIFDTSGTRTFLGIPYAAPPVGDLRWRAPLPAHAWKAPLDASRFASHCPQVATPFGVASTTEDCLYLNVYAPASLLGGRPVMVYIHGGAFQTGESDDYGPRKLVDQGVVVVTINYRLGSLGFLANPTLTAESPEGTSGNYGIMDQQAALRWVRRNIAAFGGDPGNVTIFGESAGGMSVHTHLASPKSQGLFQRAIAESGSYSLTQATLAAAESAGTAFATAVGCSNQDAACLRAVPVATLLANQSLSATAYLPNVDGTILTQSVGTAFSSGQFNRVPVIEGSNHDEFRLFVAYLFELPNGPITAAQYPAYVGALLGLPEQAVAVVIAQYPLSNYASPALALGAIGTDAAFSCNTLLVQKSLSQYVPTWAYEFDDANAPQRFLPPVSFPYGAYHSAELQYLFDLPVTVPAPALTAAQEQLSSAMVSYWSRFAGQANPNSFATPLWLQQTASTDRTEALLAPTPQPGTATAFAADHNCAFWAALESSP
jgi:para-nitrobenzyl esterase